MIFVVTLSPAFNQGARIRATKNPTAFPAVGLLKSLRESEPDRRTAKQQRLLQQSNGKTPNHNAERIDRFSKGQRHFCAVLERAFNG